MGLAAAVQSYGTMLVALERHLPVDLLQDASADSFAAWLREHPSVELISRDRGTTFADGATRGAPQALQIADRWHIIHNLGEALEKVLARHHTDLKRAFTPSEEERQVLAALDQQAASSASWPVLKLRGSGKPDGSDAERPLLACRSCLHRAGVVLRLHECLVSTKRPP